MHLWPRSSWSNVFTRSGRFECTGTRGLVQWTDFTEAKQKPRPLQQRMSCQNSAAIPLALRSDIQIGNSVPLSRAAPKRCLIEPGHVPRAVLGCRE